MSTDQHSHFARTLSRLRRKAGLSQHALAQLAGLPRQTINLLEGGKSADPLWNTVQRLALALGIQ
jgi:DNA-binding XRE family transcriptional regulator